MTWLVSSLLIPFFSVFALGNALPADILGELNQGPRARLKDFGRFHSPVLKSLLAEAGDVVVPAGTQLNSVFDLQCLSAPSSKQGKSWIAAQVRLPKARLESAGRAGSKKSRLHSLTWTLPVEIGWKKLQEIAESERCLQALAPDIEIRALSTWLEDPYMPQQDHLDFISWGRGIERFAPAIGKVSPTVIAIADTGVDLDHPDLIENAWKNSREIPGNGVDDDGNGYIDDINGFDFGDFVGASGPKSRDPYFRHGTHVAGLASARTGNAGGGSGVHGFSKVMSLNIFGSSRTARISTLENALRYAADNGADVINLSIGGREFTSTMESALRYVLSRGVVIVAASGNDGVEVSANPDSPRYVTPATYARKYKGMISVTSVDVRTGTLSSFANFSMFLVELAAPGAFRSGTYTDGLLSTVPGGGYGWLSGTSMAAPVVTGAVGLAHTWLRAAGQPSDPASIENALIESAKPSDKIIGFTRYGKVLDIERLATWLETNAPIR